MLKFVFILTIWNPDGSPPDIYIMDDDLTGTECIQKMDNYSANDPAFTKGTPYCKIDLHASEDELEQRFETALKEGRL